MRKTLKKDILVNHGSCELTLEYTIEKGGTKGDYYTMAEPSMENIEKVYFEGVDITKFVEKMDLWDIISDALLESLED
jgi:hypothetical protein